MPHAKPKPAPKHSVLIVDDHPVVVEGLTQRLNDEPDLTVCATAANSAEALRVARDASPDIAVVDLSLGGESGLELIKDLLIRRPGMKVLVLSMHSPLVYAERALRAGARGYVMKEEGTGKVVEGIRRVLAGGVYLREDIGQSILARIADAGVARSQKSSPSVLSDRELEVLRLIGQGLSAASIAQRLHRSVKTVESHRANIKQKLNLKDAEDLLRYAIEWERGDRV